MLQLETKRQRLLGQIRGYGSCAVAFSGGVDSAVVAKAAQLALGPAAVAVTGVSASLAGGELDGARQLAAQIGIRHVAIDTREFDNAAYTRNGPDRCYHCKDELYLHMEQLAERLQVAVLLNGANLDDQGDYRPGVEAAEEHHVHSPLAECGLNKADVRQLARDWDLTVWDKPASPCLASRVAYGEEVTPQRLAMVDRAEHYLRQLGLATVRVRYHQGDLARLEIPPDAIEQVCRESTRLDLIQALRGFGFKFVTLDMEGFRSGSLNQLIPSDTLRMRS
ncbi:MAG: ATP-dependent sacrificial sulfur transferase LarE [Pirellulales bacterium]